MAQAGTKAFISYASEDVDLARGLKRDLARYGVKAFVAVDDMNAAVAEGSPEWLGVLEDQLRSVPSLILLVSPESLESHWVEGEWRIVHERFHAGEAVDLIPICVRDVTVPTLPAPLNRYQALDARDEEDRETTFDILLARLRTATRRARVVGMKPGRFWGRVRRHRGVIDFFGLSVGALLLAVAPLQRRAATRGAQAVLQEARAVSGKTDWKAVKAKLTELGVPAVAPILADVREHAPSPSGAEIDELMEALVTIGQRGPSSQVECCRGLEVMFSQRQAKYYISAYHAAIGALGKLHCPAGRAIIKAFRQVICSPAGVERIEGPRDGFPILKRALDRALREPERDC